MKGLHGLGSPCYCDLFFDRGRAGGIEVGEGGGVWRLAIGGGEV